MTAPVFVTLTRAGLVLAERARAGLPGAVTHGLAGRVSGADVDFRDTTGHLRALFDAGTPIIGVCAAGILIRALAPVLGDKTREPPVVALAEDGSVAVPLLGGHHGANDLAVALAGMLGGVAAVTTGGDLRFGVALDRPPPGWVLANPGDARAFVAALLGGEEIAATPALPGWLSAARLPVAAGGALTIAATPFRVEGSGRALIYHPAAVAVGVGCERGCTAAELDRLVRTGLDEAGVAAASVGVVVSLDLKADEPAVHAVAAALGVPARFFPAPVLEAEAPRLRTPSDTVFRETGCHGVAEGAALAAAGAGGALILAKRKSARATCALALAAAPLDAAAIGQGRGRLSVIGLGPGQAAWRTPEAETWLAAASDIVGYHLYLDLLGPAPAGQRRHGYDLGAETERVRTALALAAAGAEVALVSSGDAGIYAMAALVFEQVEHGPPAWGRIEIRVAPGISALQAAAARAGAPLGHDFCTVSLSDLLTPWARIERRIRAAAEGDFVIAVYNPVSRRRTRQFERFVEILAAHRLPETPAVVARNLGRPGETVTVTTLAGLATAEIDMLTLVLVGSTETRRVDRGDGGAFVYTPRGYGR